MMKSHVYCLVLERKAGKVKSLNTRIRCDSTHDKAERVRYCNTFLLAVLHGSKHASKTEQHKETP